MSTLKRRHWSNKKYDDYILKFMVQRHLEQEIKVFLWKARNRDEVRLATGAPGKGTSKGKGKENAQNNSERLIAYVGSAVKH